MITVFTPSYNRADTLERLYNSLKNQSVKNFEWIVIDDGSTDRTEELVKKFILESPFKINYKKVENGGKMRAINIGVKMACGDLFFIVDSDDFLDLDAIKLIEEENKNLPENFAGMVFRKLEIDDSEKVKETNVDFGAEKIDSTPLDIFYNKKIYGDKAEIIKTEILKNFPFPEIEGEKFFPEGYIWNQIGEKYLFRYINRGIYYYKYLDSGYTKRFKEVLRKNPKGFKIYYRYMIGRDIPLKNRIKFLIRYLQVIFYNFEKNRRK